MNPLVRTRAATQGVTALPLVFTVGCSHSGESTLHAAEGAKDTSFPGDQPTDSAASAGDSDFDSAAWLLVHNNSGSDLSGVQWLADETLAVTFTSLKAGQSDTFGFRSTGYGTFTAFADSNACWSTSFTLDEGATVEVDVPALVGTYADYWCSLAQ